MLTVKGKYEDGSIHFLEPVPQKTSDVLVIFLEEAQALIHNQIITFGMFAGDGQSTERDFHVAEFSGDPDDGLGWA